MGTDLPLKASNNSEKSKDSLKKTTLIFGCCSLIISLAGFVAIPILFIFTMAMGMGAGSSSPGDSQLLGSLAIGGLILLGVSAIVAVVAGIVGVVMLIFWGIKKLKN
jgi:hypothetical protein